VIVVDLKPQRKYKNKTWWFRGCLKISIVL
jgi:hypothetical protein